MAKNLFSKWVDFIGAQARVMMTASRGGPDGKVMLEVYPYPHEGNAPGVLTQFMLPWREALKFAMALKDVAARIKEGQDVVPGTAYAPVLFNLGQGGEWDNRLRLVLTSDDCETWMHLLVDAAEFASKEPGLIVAHMAR